MSGFERTEMCAAAVDEFTSLIAGHEVQMSLQFVRMMKNGMQTPYSEDHDQKKASGKELTKKEQSDTLPERDGGKTAKRRDQGVP